VHTIHPDKAQMVTGTGQSQGSLRPRHRVQFLGQERGKATLTARDVLPLGQLGSVAK